MCEPDVWRGVQSCESLFPRSEISNFSKVCPLARFAQRKTWPLRSVMSDSENEVVPNTQDEDEEIDSFGVDTYEAGIIRRVELINFMCHSYAPPPSCPSFAPFPVY